MFDNFELNFKADFPESKKDNLDYHCAIDTNGFSDFICKHGGSSFNGGLYRIHSANNIDKWNKIVCEAFPNFSNRITCFSYDWLGRHFAIDGERKNKNEPLILMLEPGTGEALEIPVNFIQLHEDELINYTDEALAINFYTQWLNAGNKFPDVTQCVGYKKPLFLGGSDKIENLELIDLEVYWSISGQLLSGVRGLEAGTSINNISIE